VVQSGGFSSTSSILTPRPLQAVVRLVYAAQEARIVFQLIVEPVILGRESDQQSGRSSIACNNDLLAFGLA
jgi:hypothetical protein